MEQELHQQLELKNQDNNTIGVNTRQKSLIIMEIMSEIKELGLDVLKGDSMQYEKDLAKKYGKSSRTISRYIKSAMDAVYMQSVEAVNDVRVQHILEYEEMYHEARLEGDKNTALKMKQAIENLYGFHRPQIQQVIHNYIKEEAAIYDHSNWSIEDLKLLKALEEKNSVGRTNPPNTDLPGRTSDNDSVEEIIPD